MRIPTAIFWSGGKDSAYALYRALLCDKYEVKYLVTTLNNDYKRISMHGVSEQMLDKQAHALGIPVQKVYVHASTHQAYEDALLKVLRRLRDQEHILHYLAGDIFLEDVRTYREQLLAKEGLSALFPIWGEDTYKLSRSMLNIGIETCVCCVQEHLKPWLGQVYNHTFLDSLPKDVDPCGEQGEFHSYCYQAPIFSYHIPYQLGEKIYRTYSHKKVQSGFWFVDILPT